MPKMWHLMSSDQSQVNVKVRRQGRLCRYKQSLLRLKKMLMKSLSKQYQYLSLSHPERFACPLELDCHICLQNVPLMIFFSHLSIMAQKAEEWQWLWFHTVVCFVQGSLIVFAWILCRRASQDPHFSLILIILFKLWYNDSNSVVWINLSIIH